MSRRPVHKIAHATCPYGQFNWADCDSAASHRWGRCRAEVQRKGASEPGECSNWAIGEEGWCGQHYISLRAKAMAEARRAEYTLQLNASIDAFIAKTQQPDYDWWSRLSKAEDSTRGLAGVVAGPRVERGKPAYETGRETAPPRRARKPFRLTELA